MITQKISRIILLFTSLCFVLSGCWDKKEIEENAYVIAIGLDPSDAGGIKVTYNIANPQVGSAKGVNVDEPPASIVSFTAPDLTAARDTATAFVTRKVNYNHTNVLIVSEELARKEDFFNYISTAVKDRELQRDLTVIVTKEKAKEFFDKNKPELETRPHKYYQFMINRTKETGFVPVSDLHRYMQKTELDSDLFLSLYATATPENQKYGNEDEYLAGEIKKESGNPTQVIGSAVFKHGKMIGLLTGEETRMALLLTPKAKDLGTMLTSYQDPLDEKYRISTRVSKPEGTEISMDFSKDPVEIKVNIPLNIEIVGIPSLIDYAIDMDKQMLLEKSIKQQIEKKAMELIKKTQEEFKGQPFYWSLPGRKYFSTVEEWKNYDFDEKYKDMEVEVTIDITLAGFGEQIITPKYPKKE
ncbi:Ger(x)C family spore germination protein [Bacillaceae bacterium S4-13-58]